MHKINAITFKMTDGHTIHLDASRVESVTDYGDAMSLVEMRSGAKHTVVGNAADVLGKVTGSSKEAA